MRTVLILAGLTSGALVSQASVLYLYSHPGGPMQYNGHTAIWTDEGFVTKLSVSFEVPEAIRIQTVKAWINGGGGSMASFSIIPLTTYWEAPLFRSFEAESAGNAPAKWQGISELKWDLQPGSYRLYITAPSVPYAYGYHGPIPNLDSLLTGIDFRDYSEPDNPNPIGFGLEVYGTQLSAVPEPSSFGLMGGTLLLALAATRRVQQRRRLRQDKTRVTEDEGKYDLNRGSVESGA